MIAVCAAKFVGYVCKKMGRQGVTWAGKVAIKICPDILEQLSSQVRKAIFATCGTNGKTTTNNMLCAALEAEGQKVICNHTGSNMLNGVVAAFVLASKWNGKIDADYACIVRINFTIPFRSQHKCGNNSIEHIGTCMVTDYFLSFRFQCRTEHIVGSCLSICTAGCKNSLSYL